ncbi:hypothetical protein C818_01593 [Lachnospiraceae bacterium MD308]|jgi:Uncharacterized membrane-associated protein/domain|nr:hypothetical protein C818_01593 [Lachnospiraceae bacterium MD308]MCI8503118.1 MarR family transcriptional regulator [Dorea sp.]
MEYLKRVLGVQVDYVENVYKCLPNYLISRYEVKKVLLDELPVFFLYVKVDLEPISAVKKHIKQIKKIESIPVVFVLKQMTFYQRENFIKERISFVVENKQIYLPFMGIFLQKRCDAEKSERKEILPSAQMLLLYFIYQGTGEMTSSKAAKALRLTATSISRASKQLEKMGLIRTKKQGVQKIIFSEQTPRELFESASEVMISPVKRCVYIPKEELQNVLLKSGDLALAEYSMLNPASVRVYAADSIAKWNHVLTNRLQNSETQVAVELWRYSPEHLAKGNTVDPLSLALSFRNIDDERVEEAVEEMLDTLWRKIDGSRN